MLETQERNCSSEVKRKESKEGVAVMCRAIEDMWKRAVNEGEENRARNIVLRMLAAGKYTVAEIADISGLSIEEVKKLQSEKSA